MWYCEDTPLHGDHDDAERSSQNAFVYQKNGLFPAAYPSDHESLNSVLDYFSFMGIFLAKSLQDQRLVDMPFSYPLLKVICAYKEESRDNATLDDLFIARDIASEDSEPLSSPRSTSSLASDNSKLDLDGILNLDDLCLIDPHRGGLLKQLRAILDARKDSTDNDEEIFVEVNGSKIGLDDLG